MFSRILLSILAVTCLAVFLATPAVAQEQAEEEASTVRRSVAWRGWGLWKQRQAHARTSRSWSHFSMFSQHVGLNNNVYLSPESDASQNSLEESAAALTSTLIMVGIFYPTSSDRVLVSAEVNGADYRSIETGSAPDRMNVDGAIEYKHRFSNTARVYAKANLTRENDDARDIFGDEYARDFGRYGASLSSRFDYEVADNSIVGIKMQAKRTDYDEVGGETSLDSWRMGPSLRYKYRSGNTTVRLWYDLSFQTYDEERASLLDGSELASNPTEKHKYSKMLLWVSRDFGPAVSTDVKYTYRTKDDHFQSYESYSGSEFEGRVSYQPMQALSLTISGFLKLRNYDFRPSEVPGQSLTADKWGGRFGAAYHINPHLALMGGYAHSSRDTNRDTGTTYLDYNVSKFDFGVALGF